MSLFITILTKSSFPYDIILTLDPFIVKFNNYEMRTGGRSKHKVKFLARE